MGPLILGNLHMGPIAESLTVGMRLRGGGTPRPIQTEPLSPLEDGGNCSLVPNYRVFGVSILGIVIMVLGRYLIVGYLDP